MNENERRERRRWITLGEIIAIAALVVSAIGVWISWKSGDDGPTRVVEQRQAIPLTLRSKREDDGTRLAISPVEPTHALESLILKIEGGSPISVGSDGELSANDVESALGAREGEPKNATERVRARVEARYVEAGQERTSSATYTLRYQWKGGGLFGGRSLHLVSLSRG
jgi:hypothetical protein